MKIIVLVALSFISLSSFAKTLVVSQIIDEKETIIVQKDISDKESGIITYNLCSDLPEISSNDYQRCESRVGYMNTKSGSTVIEYQHYEFVKFMQLTNKKITVISEERFGNTLILGPGNVIISKTPIKTIRVFVK